ncbi:MAG: hypothetical protein SFV81_25360 [Pirellulaceae bacterium]|nr:hypothetical protein [Pirellulaceae bacterium]
MTDPKRTPTSFTWVRMGEHGPAIRWGAVTLLVGSYLFAYLIVQTILYVVLQVPFRMGIVSAVFAVHLGFLVTVVEYQRQNLNASKSIFRFNLAYLFAMTLLAALFFGSITSEVRATQRGLQRNSILKAELDKLIRGGNVYFGEQNGKRISCEITRPDFSDNDLADLIAAATNTDSKVCELTMLVLEKTAVTNEGLHVLSVCSKLEFLSLPASIALTDATLETISTCKELNYLSFDQKKISEAQFDQLSKRLPDTKINGVSYRDRQSAKQN